MDNPIDSDFIRKYETFEADAAKHVIKPNLSTEAELRELIAHLIERRQAIKQAEVESLEAKARQLAGELKETERQKLLAEISCFKDILGLQRQLAGEDGKS